MSSTYPGADENLAIAKIIEVDGSHFVAEILPAIRELSKIHMGEVYSIGQFGSVVKIQFGKRILFASVSRLLMRTEYERQHGMQVGTVGTGESDRLLEADLFGEGHYEHQSETQSLHLEFERGITSYPLPGQLVYLAANSELGQIYENKDSTNIAIGVHVGSGGAKCYADMNELLGKHTAILGSTGSGKSGAAAAILHALLGHGAEMGYQTWEPQIVMLDPHGEYATAFQGQCKVFSGDDGSLQLPYWLLSLSELISLLIGKTEFVATSQTNILKDALLAVRKSNCKIADIAAEEITVDSPVPFTWSAFITEIDTKKPSDKAGGAPYLAITEKLRVLKEDQRMKFLMAEWDGKSDGIGSLLEALVAGDEPIKIIDLSGVPNEVAGIASALVARTLFALKVWQTPEEREKSPTLLVCEEAHRYVPNKGEAQYEAAQSAIQRIAKEGRKYGLGLVLVSQRPSELDATVLSQCNSWVVLRLTNSSDIAHVKSALPDSLCGLTDLLSGLRRQEAIFVGQAAKLPSRVFITTLPTSMLPKSADVSFETGWKYHRLSPEQLRIISRRWRLQRF